MLGSDSKKSAVSLISFLCVAVFLTGCTEGKYPLSGKDCSPEDPVLELDAKDCIPPV